jgi:hypothetical protein
MARSAGMRESGVRIASLKKSRMIFFNILIRHKFTTDIGSQLQLIVLQQC